MESHYCRASSTRMYQDPNLNLRKMYAMYLDELETRGIVGRPSFSTYARIFKTKNLSFHSPKKDLCSLCVSYREGDEIAKQKLRTRYHVHIAEQVKVRVLKSECKQKAKEDSSSLCGVFDLHQVIYLPISNEGDIFYKSRLAAYSFTFYNIATKKCVCFVWNETVSKRGSSEVATCISHVLEYYSTKGIKSFYLYADGCAGQNKNS
nr:unnamed protein product [Callosobruchus analis]